MGDGWWLTGSGAAVVTRTVLVNGSVLQMQLPDGMTDGTLTAIIIDINVLFAGLWYIAESKYL